MNRLAHESSPYLRQHQANPVDWYPWGEEALRLARESNKPILLSVGYAACHWCHVMAHESFENPAIAALMNERFVNIKVDREERPELDRIYQPVAQTLTGGGGWPLTVFLTPDQKPFYGGTYFPPEDRYGRPGFARVLEAVSNAFRNDPANISQNAERLTAAILEAEATHAGQSSQESDFGAGELRKCAGLLFDHSDPVHGGLGGAPKFPNVPVLGFLWRAGLATDSSDWKNAVLLALRRMAERGIYDQLGGGFHRYSVDQEWAVPHFEKMLYDNALLLRIYSEALLSGGSALSESDLALFVRIVNETADYLFREIKSPEGLFYASQDADSEGQEGKYYVWDERDLLHAGEKGLTQTEAALFARHYGIAPGGNFEHGKTVLYVAEPLEEIARSLSLTEGEAYSLLNSAREKLLEVRSARIPPGRDDKILTSWNALAISGLAWASLALRSVGEPDGAGRLLSAAETAFCALVSAVEKDGKVAGTMQKGMAKTNGTLDDYAFLAAAALDLARSCEEPRIAGYLAHARKWLDHLFLFFEADAGFYFTGKDHEKLLFRPRGIHDAAIPSSGSVALGVAVALAELETDRALYERSRKHLSALEGCALRNPYGAAELLSVLLLREASPVVVSGADSRTACRHGHVFRKALEEEGGAAAQPGGTVLCHRNTCTAPQRSHAELLAALSPMLKI